MKATFRGLRVAVIALVIYWLALFIATHIPANAIMKKLHESDKLVHAAAFTGLSFLVAWAVPTRSRRWVNVLVALLICVPYAAIDELLQIPVGRTADWLDFYADCIGVVMGLSIYVLGRAIIMTSGLKFFDTEESSGEPGNDSNASELKSI